jgi:alanyl-tRNA synthetase
LTRLQQEAKRLAREAHDLRLKLAMAGGAEAAAPAEAPVQIAGVTAVIRSMPGLDKASLRDAADSFKSKLKSGVVVLASQHARRQGRHRRLGDAGPEGPRPRRQRREDDRPLVGGGGGGRPDFAEAGGRDPDRIETMLTESRRVIGEMLGGMRVEMRVWGMGVCGYESSEGIPVFPLCPLVYRRPTTSYSPSGRVSEYRGTSRPSMISTIL